MAAEGQTSPDKSALVLKVRKKLFAFLILFLSSAFAIGFDSFGSATSGDLKTADLSSALMVPFAAVSRHLGAKSAQEAVTVLLVDNDLRKDEGIDTPYMPYGKLAKYLTYIVDTPTPPRAIFLDFYYARYQTPDVPDGLDELVAALKKAHLRGITVYTGAIDPNPVLDRLRTEVTQVSLSWPKELPLNYPLVGDAFVTSKSAPKALTAASQIYQDICEQKPRPPEFECSEYPMLNTYSSRVLDRPVGERETLPKPRSMFLIYQPYVRDIVNRHHSGLDYVAYEAGPLCDVQPQGYRFFMWGIARNLLKSINGDTRRSPNKCVSVPQFPLSYLVLTRPPTGDALVRDGFRNDYIAGKVVMIGDGLGNDRFETPGFGQLDGVMQHAIALQTLLENGASYRHWPGALAISTRQGEFSLPYSFFLEQAAVFFVLMVVVYAMNRRALKPAKPIGPGALIHGVVFYVLFPVLVIMSLSLIEFFILDWPPANILPILMSIFGLFAITELDDILKQRWLTLTLIGTFLALLGGTVLLLMPYLS